MKRIIILFFSLIVFVSGYVQAMDKIDGNETKVKLTVGAVSTTAMLNNTVSARDLISKLPYTVKVSRSSVDYCGILPAPLKNDDAEAQQGWKNGDISYIPGSDYIAFYFGGETGSASSPYIQHIIGKVDDLAAINGWPKGSIEIKIELIK